MRKTPNISLILAVSAERGVVLAQLVRKGVSAPIFIDFFKELSQILENINHKSEP